MLNAFGTIFGQPAFSGNLAGMKQTFVIIFSAGANRDLSKGAREQRHWEEHAEFIDQLSGEGFILMGGPLVDDGGALLIVRAESKKLVFEIFQQDPWVKQKILHLDSIQRWQIFLNVWKNS